MVCDLCSYSKLYTTALRPRWYMRHVPSVQNASTVQTDLMADYDPLLSLRNTIRGCLMGPVVRYTSLLSVSIRIPLQGIEDAEVFEKPPILVTADKVALHDILISRPYSFPKPTARIEQQFIGDAVDKGLHSTQGHITSRCMLR